MKVIMKVALPTAIAIRDAIRNFHYTDGGDWYTTISEGPGWTTHWTSSSYLWCVEICGFEAFLTFTGSRTSFQAGCAIGGPQWSRTDDPGLCLEGWMWNGSPIQVVEVRSSLPKDCPWKHDPWASDYDIHGWLEEYHQELMEEARVAALEDVGWQIEAAFA